MDLPACVYNSQYLYDLLSDEVHDLEGLVNLSKGLPELTQSEINMPLTIVRLDIVLPGSVTTNLQIHLPYPVKE